MNYREAYETWLKEFAADQATVDELKAIAGDEKEIEDRFYTELSFGTAGMRGVLGAGTNRMNQGLCQLYQQPEPGIPPARRGHRL